MSLTNNIMICVKDLQTFKTFLLPHIINVVNFKAPQMPIGGISECDCVDPTERIQPKVKILSYMQLKYSCNQISLINFDKTCLLFCTSNSSVFKSNIMELKSSFKIPTNWN